MRKKPLSVCSKKMCLKTYILYILIFTLGFFVFDSHAQNINDVNVSLNLKDVTIEDVLQSIEQKTSFTFAYQDNLTSIFPKKISIKAKEESVASVLNRIPRVTALAFKQINGNTIALNKIEKRAKDDYSTKTVIQSIIQGVVTDATGQPLPGASVIEKGTENGVITDFDGKYSITVTNADAVLVFSFIGFQNQEITVGDQETINIQMKEDSAQLDEIVVIGYGTLSRSKVLGAVSSVVTEDIAQLQVSGVDAAIAGRVAGVQIVSNGVPGNGSQINIRGISTLTAGTNPLIVVDGYPLTEGSDLDAINPNDVQSMNVLKDAASTAIYGSRGANGVILITTKKGEADNMTFNFNTYTGFQDVLNQPKFMNAYQFAQMVKEARDWGYVSSDPLNRKESDDNAVRVAQGAVARHLIPTNFDKYLAGTPGLTDNNWLDDVFRKGRIESHDLSVSGRSGSTNWYISGGYFNQEGLILGSGFKRYTTKLNLESKLHDKIKFGINLAPSISNTKSIIEGWTDSPMQQAILAEPFFTPYNNEGDLNISQQIRWHNNGGTDGALAENPVAIALQKKDETNRFRLFGSTFLEIEIIERLKFKTLLGGDYETSLREQFRPSTVGRYRNDVSAVVPWAKEQTKERKNLISENTLDYTKSIDKHSLNLLAGYSYQKETYKTTSVDAPLLNSNEIENIAGASTTTTSKGISEWVKISYFGRVQYDYDSKYFLTLSIRRDGSSRFGANSKFGNFSSFSTGWVVSNEDFFPKNPILSNLKLRYSLGQSGNDQIGPFGAISRLKPLDGFIDGGLAPGQIPSTSPNDDLSWETSVTSNFGFDFGLLDNKLNLIVDYFIANTEDMLLEVPVPLQSGFTQSLQNVGKMENRGLEIALSTSEINLGPVKWYASVNFTTVKNEVKALGPGQSEIISGPHITKVGNTIGELFGYVVDGIYKSQNEIDASAQKGTNVRVGDWKIVDINGDGQINDDDRKAIGSTLPDFTYGFNNRFAFKNFDLNIFVDGLVGTKLLSTTVRNSTNGQGFANQLEWYYKNRWHPTNNPNGTLARPDYTQSSERGRANLSTAFIEDASFFRVRNISLGYNLPEKVMARIGMNKYLNKLRVYVTAKNPILITDFKGFSPEQRTTNPLAPSNTGGRYPLNKSFVIGMDISF